MEWLSPPNQSDSLARPVERVDFDMIRAIIGARQSASATALAVVASDGDAAVHDTAAPRESLMRVMHLLAGRTRSDAGPTRGAFAVDYGANHDDKLRIEGEIHA